jgi:hypothetical protein
MLIFLYIFQNFPPFTDLEISLPYSQKQPMFHIKIQIRPVRSFPSYFSIIYFHISSLHSLRIPNAPFSSSFSTKLQNKSSFFPTRAKRHPRLTILDLVTLIILNDKNNLCRLSMYNIYLKPCPNIFPEQNVTTLRDCIKQHVQLMYWTGSVLACGGSFLH